MHHPQIGERVFVRPTNPSVRVQRGEGLYGQFLPVEGLECLWDDFLHCRLAEGVIEWRPVELRPLPVEPPKSQVFVINTEDPNWRAKAAELLRMLQPSGTVKAPPADGSDNDLAPAPREGGG